MTALNPRKVSLLSRFLEESFVGCSVHDQEDADGVAQLYQIFDETVGKLLHRVTVSRAFLMDHAESEIVPALQELALLACLRLAGERRVIVRSQMIEIEEPASRSRPVRDTPDRQSTEAR